MRKRKGDPEPLKLDYLTDSRVRLRLPDFVRSVGTIPHRVLDLIEIAAYVFAADRLIPRGQPDALIYDSWSRFIQLRIRVRDVGFWNSKITKAKLSALLTYITGDREYKFDFLPGHATDRTHLFDSEEFLITPDKPHHVMLFSGGLDSLAGAIERLNISDDVVCLISHRSGQPSTARTQDQLVSALKQRFPNRIKHYRFYTGLTNHRAASETQRTRTFLYGTIAFALATALGQHEATFYENGITSLNFPRRQDLLNSRASRTTHPRTMYLLSDFLSHLATKPISITNAYSGKTKADLLEVIKRYGEEVLIPSSVTCSRTSMTRGDHTHCGGCLQCVDRRFSASAASLSDLDHPGLYTFDFLSQGVVGETKTVVIDYVRLGLEFDACTPDSFQERWLSEIAEAMVPGCREDEFLREVYELTKRFGKQTVEALKGFSRIDDVTRNPVPNSLFTIIHEREYLKEESERFARKLAEKLKRAVPTMFANHSPKNENDLNDKLEALMQADADGYRREFPATMFALAKVVPDHELRQYNVLVESKYLREATSASKMTDQIAADITKYPSSAFIVFVIYDPYRSIRDDIEFIRDIENRRRCLVSIIR